MTTTGAPLTALVLNCTLKPSPEESSTDLDWTPSRSSVEGARELLDGLAEGAVGASPALGGPGSAG